MRRCTVLIRKCLRTLSGLLIVVGLSGCFGSDVPIITSGTAQNVGQTFEYWSRVRQDPKAEKLRFVRQSGNYYQLQLLDGDNAGAGGQPFANGILFRRIATRKGQAVYLVQFDLARFELDPDFSPQEIGYRYFAYLLSVSPQQIGSVGTFNCERSSVLRLARDAGLSIACRHDDVTYPFLGGELSDKAITSFLLALMKDGDIEWEDDTGRGVLDWVE